MRVAIVGSRGLSLDVAPYVPSECTVIVSGGARGIDACAKRFAVERKLPLVEFLPDYATHGKRAPLVRNSKIVEASDLVLAFWDGRSCGTVDTMRKASIALMVELRAFLVYADGVTRRFDCPWEQPSSGT